MCSLGYYSEANSLSCKRCEPGYYCPDSRASARKPCDANYFSLDGMTHCFLCPAGKKCSIAAADTGLIKLGEPIIQKCPYGMYSDEGQLDCLKCPAGKACNSRDS